MVGDPTGRSKERPLLSPEIIAANIERLRPQMQPFLNFDSGAVIVDNSSWLLKLNLVEFLRDVGSKFNVHQMLSFDTYRTRLEHGLTYLELSYQLLQGYDYLHLFRERGCRVEVGGSDQWANILAGVDLIRKSEGAEAFALVCPLMTLPGGAKMSKSEGSAIWLSPQLTSPYDYYQYWINAADQDVENLLTVFTFTPMDEVRRIGRLEGAEMRAGKEFLAYEITSLVHGREEADRAREASRALFAGEGSTDSAPTASYDAKKLESGLSVVELLEDVKLAPSRREARRLVEQGAVTLNSENVDAPTRQVTLADFGDGGSLLIRVGKKRFLRVRAE
jgi:tyrosyl-tRNA synthetase